MPTAAFSSEVATISHSAVPSSSGEKEWILSRRDQMKVAWHEVPGNKIKVRAFLLFPGTSCQATFALIPPG
jgi:hypothetical protein